MTLALMLQRTAVAPIGGLLHVLIIALVLALVCYLAFWVMSTLGVPEPIKRVVTVLIVVIAFIWILSVMLPLLGVSLG